MILKNTPLGLTIILCTVLDVAIGIIIGNMPNRNNQ